jgi:hypothetical protein
MSPGSVHNTAWPAAPGVVCARLHIAHASAQKATTMWIAYLFRILIPELG